MMKVLGPLYLTVALWIVAAVSLGNAAIVAPLYDSVTVTPAGADNQRFP